MIHTLIKLDRPLIVLDTETTGVDVKRDQIWELGVQIYTAEGMTREWVAQMRPTIAPMTAGAERTHGRSAESLAHLHPFKYYAQDLALGFRDCDFAGKNIRFDLRILKSEMTRAGVDWSYEGARILDAERLEAIGVPRTLSHLYKKYTGQEHVNAHGALGDIRATTVVLCAQLETYPDIPRDFDALHRLQWPGWIDAEGLFRFIDGEPCFGSWGKHKGDPMRIVPKGYYRWMMGENFSARVKEIVADAIVGIYPVEMK